tara:strand:- start:292 stop:615 length:324 start_codon:yes stop_codon:yes gene_type:complete
MAKKGLRAWVKENWVDIANKKPDGSYPKCGRSGGEKRKNYPKCVPASKAAGMSKSQKRTAVARKKKVEAGGRRADKKPNRAKTLAQGGLVQRRAGAAIKGFDFKGVF